MPEAGQPREQAGLRMWHVAAWLWLACMLAMGWQQWTFWREGRLSTDVLALLPSAGEAPEVQRAGRLLADSVSRQLVVLVGAQDWDGARRAARRWKESLAASGAPVQPAGLPELGDAVLGFYGRWNDRLLTPRQREDLSHAQPQALVQRALAQLHQPGATARLSDFAADPLGLWPEWLAARAQQSRARPRDGELWVSGEGAEWVVLPYAITGAPFALDGDEKLRPAFEEAFAAARAEVPGAMMLAAGLPLHAEAAAVRASREINTIGWGSLAAVVLLAWFAFRRLSPLLLTALSVVSGVGAGLAVTGMVFGEVHLLTLVFGATLMGVAEDYGIHYFAARQAHPDAQPAALVRSLLPGLSLALATSVLAYLALGLAPFPGLRQIAVFSASGLAGAFLTAVCWFPVLDRSQPRDSALARRIRGNLEAWPRWAALPGRRWLLTAGIVVIAAGVPRLSASDDLRAWQGSPPELLREQALVARLLQTPSVAQFYLVTAENPQQLLEREEALKPRLDALVVKRSLGGYAAVSDWVPSLRQQREDAALRERVDTGVLAGVNRTLGENLVRASFTGQASLDPQTWLASPASVAAARLWLGGADGRYASVILLQGLHAKEALPELARAAEGLPGVHWVDRVADVSTMLAHYRWAMTALLLAGHALVFGALWARFRRKAWRAWLPTAIGTVLTLGVAGLLGEPLQLSSVLALLLLLGIGVDYGIFLLEHEGDGAAWLAVVVGAGSTWLAFGLLALSSTPALHAFGLVLMVGIPLVWLLSPCLRPPEVGAA